MFSRRSAFEPQRNRLELARLEALAAGRELLDLTESNPTRADLPRFDSAFAALDQPAARAYMPEPFGLPAARAAVSGWMAARGVVVDSAHVILTASTSEAYAFLFKLLCDDGDEVLCPAPSYPLFEHLARLEGVSVARYPLRYDGRWYVSEADLVRARGPRARALVVVHPNNPTGSYLKEHELAQLYALGLPIISDEVFASYPLCDDATRVASAHCGPRAGVHPNTLVFSLHGLSKLAGLPQLKLAWICITGPDALVEDARARLELIADSFLSASTPIQLALPSILATCEPIARAIRTRLARNLDLLAAAVQGSAASLLHVEGGWYATLRLPSVLDDEAWALDLLRNADVLVQPGYFYDFEAGPFIVLSLLTHEATFREGTRRVFERIARAAVERDP